jgi:ribonucleotide reductase alpha subunit
MEVHNSYTREQVYEASLAYFGGDALPANVFTDKYALRDKEGRYFELTPDDMHRRLAREFARIEAKYPNPMSEADIYSALKGFTEIVPQGSPMFGIGNDHQLVSTSNCSVIAPPQDTMSSIFDAARDMANLYKRRFGVGVDISYLRPAGASVNNAAVTSTGAWSFADFYSFVTRMVGQSGRRGALMITLDVRHPDVEQFIRMKEDLTKVTGANVSVKVADDFMRAVENDESYVLHFPVGAAVGERQFERTVRAREIFDLIAQTANQTAEPGVLYWDTIKNNLPLDAYPGFETVSTNPCLTGDTRILTIDGPKSFAELAATGEDVLVYAVDKDTNEAVVRWMRNPRKTRTNVEVLEVEFDSGLKVRATPDHNFISVRGEKVRASELRAGQSVSAFHLNRHRDGHLRTTRQLRRSEDQQYAYVHRMVADAMGWEIDGRIVHHKDGNPLNNRPENLEVLGSNAEHNSLHYPSRKANGFGGTYERTPAIRQKIREAVNAFYEKNGTSHLAGANHKVVAVRPAGTADVYNGTVDDVHTYIVVDPESIHESSLYTGIVSANCGELPLCPNDSCRLISIYLPSFVRNEFDNTAYFDFQTFAWRVRQAQRLSDDLVDLEIEKLTAIREQADTEDEKILFTKFIEACEGGRRTGLGTHGLADALAGLCIRYDSPEALRMADDIYKTLKFFAYDESIRLADQRGAFPIWDWETEKDCEFFRRMEAETLILPGTYGTGGSVVQSVAAAKMSGAALVTRMSRLGRRNGALLTNAPTGSVSILSRNCSSGIEPVFMLEYSRRRKVDPRTTGDLNALTQDDSGDYWETYTVYHKKAEDYREKAAELGQSTQLPDFFVTTGEIDPLMRVKMQATIQQHVDHSLSSTLNLPRETEWPTVAAIYMAAWKEGCKGVTVYRDGSRDGVLVSNEEKKAESVTEQETAEFAQRVAELEKERDELTRTLAVVEKARAVCVHRTHRGRTTSGEMFKATFRNMEGGERKAYTYVGLNEDGQPVETFVIDEQGDEELKPYASAIGKLTSLALKFGIPAAEIVGALEGLKGGSIAYEDRVYQSVPDMLAKLLRRAGERAVPPAEATYSAGTQPAPPTVKIEWGKDTGASPTVTGPNGSKCPRCGERSVYYTGGCPTCSACGWGKCS